MKTKTDILSRFLVFFVIVWLIFSVLRALYNDSKLFTQDRYLFFQNTDQTEREIYGDLSVMRKKIPVLTHNEPFLLTGNDGGLYFYLRYLLYPQEVYWVNNTSIAQKKVPYWKFVFSPYSTPVNDSTRSAAVIDQETGRKLGEITKL